MKCNIGALFAEQNRENLLIWSAKVRVKEKKV